MRLPLAAAVLAVTLVTPIAAQAPPPALAPPARIAPVVVAPNAAHFTLANGMEVVVIPDTRLAVVTHMVWYRVGSADEPAGKSGIAHFLEHLMFKGTARSPGGAFSRWLGEIGGQENAFTSWDYTGYFQRTAREHLPRLMAFEADRMVNLVLTDEVVNPERDVILEERKQVVDNNPGSQFGEQMNAALHLAHPYRIPIIGWEHEMRGLTRQDALDFYARWYTPNNAVLVVAGDVTVEEVRRLAGETYGRVPRRVEVAPRVRPAEPPHRAARRVAMADQRVQQPSWSRLYLVPSYASNRDGVPEALVILAEILGGGTGRIYRALVEEKQLAASAGAGYGGSGLDSARFSLFATPRPNVSFADVERAIDAVLAEVLEKGVTADEVDRAIQTMLASAISAQDSMGSLARLFGAGLMEGNDFERIRTWPARMARVTPEEVNAAARVWLDIRRSVTGELSRAERPRS
jgi:zinc protease